MLTQMHDEVADELGATRRQQCVLVVSEALFIGRLSCDLEL
jgi:hypothetical protein